MDQEGERSVNPCKRRNTLWTVPKWRARRSLPTSEGETYLRPLRHPAYKGHELGLGFNVKRENPAGDAKRKPLKRGPPRGKVAMNQQGADHPVVVKKRL